MNYTDIFEHLQAISLLVDTDGRIVQSTSLAEKLFDQDEGFRRGQHVADLLPAAGSRIEKWLRGDTRLSTCTVNHGGVQYQLVGTPLADSSGLQGAVLTFYTDHDILGANDFTKLRSLNRQLEAVFNASSDGIWVCDGMGKVLSINDASAKLNGIEPEKVVGKNINDLLDSEMFDQSVTAKVLASGKQETVMQFVSRTRRFLLSTGSPSFDEHGNIDMIVVNERDMTELNMLRKEVEESQRVKEKFTEELSDLSLLELERNSIVAECSKMRQLLQMSLKLSHLGASRILILGESGTGKGLLAKLIHKNSQRRKKAFVEINCAALPEQLLEAELFGYEKGAFTDAGAKGKVGLIELANNGTLFLDEIGDMPLPLQAKLLKYLDNQEIRRLGGTESIRITCSIIAATNQDLKDLVSRKLFREDLFYRLNSFVLELPPLRNRAGDVSGLVRFFLKEFNAQYSGRKTISPAGIYWLEAYSFPGNIRELKNVIENAVVLSENNCIDDFIQASVKREPESADVPASSEIPLPDIDLKARIDEVEAQCLRQARQQYATTREMAVALGISQPSVVRKLQKHQL